MFILVGSAVIGLQSSSAGSNQTDTENQTNRTLFTADNETYPALGNETIQSTLSELIPSDSGNGTNESVSISQQQQLLNRSQSTVVSNLSAQMANLSAQIANLGENASESDIAMLQRKFLESSAFGPAVLNQPYRVTVTFDSITVHDDHDHDSIVWSPLGTTSRSGEWNLYAFVQGKGIDLTEASDDRLHDVDGGDTINFPTGTEITVDIPKTLPLSILTLGNEEDLGFWDFNFCVQFGAPTYEGYIAPILSGPPSTWSDALESEGRNTADEDCKWQGLGFINKFYDPPTYGEGAHTNVVSSKGDYTLRYTITVVPPPSVGGVEPGLDCDNELGVNRVTSSSTQNPLFGPTKAVDNDLNTYWMSTVSLNPSITLDLGAQRIVCLIKIAWQDGNTHPYRFTVAVSKDGTIYTNVFSGTSSGTTISPELYGIGELDARYVKIAVTQSIQGSQNSQAKISEIDILGRFTGNEPGQPTEGPVIG